MRLKSSLAYVVSAVTLWLLLSAGVAHTWAATPGCPPTSPGELEDELFRAFTSPSFKCVNNWYIHNDPTFKNWSSGGSLNLPVVTAAIGLYRFPNNNLIWNKKPPGARNINPTGYQITYINWWTWFLASQVGRNPAADMPPGFVAPPEHPNSKLKYLKGTEHFSNVYDASVVTSVIAVRYWAYKNGHQKLIDLSQQFLRANWVLSGMAAGAGPVWTYDIPGRSPNMQYSPTAPRRPAGGYRYAGHFLPLAGTRSKLKGHWDFDDKFPLFDRAMEEFQSLPPGQNYENLVQTNVLNWLAERWSALQNAPAPAVHPPSAENLYGLTQDDRDRFRTLINSGTNASSFMPWLAGIRLSTTYRILGWDGWRVSSMEANTNGNGPNMYGIAYRKDDPNDPDPAHALATFLYPYTDRGKAAHGGSCKLFPGYMEATNAAHPNHPPKTVTMPLPTSQPLFHLVLSSGSEAYLDNTPPASWPPPAPLKAFEESSTASEAASGDIAWVTDVLPAGSVTVSDNETWNWTDSNPAPHSEAGFVHQSGSVAGWHQHYFYGATETLTVNAGDVLYAYVYLDPSNPPSELMLQWADAATGWEHRAYWGLDQLGWGTSGTVSRRYMGPMPPAGDWLRLEVPASLVGLESRTVHGMAYTLFGGKATWDEAGKNDQGGLSTSLAIGQPATQSSTAASGLASRAVDGNPEGNFFANSVTHTDYNTQAWWQVDLGGSYSIPWLNIWNRTDCCPERVSNFYVFVSDAPFTSTDLSATFNQAGVSSYYVAGSAGSPSVLAVGRSGRYVRVQLTGTNYLSLAEVEVFGQPVAAPSPPPPPPALVGYWKFDENGGTTAADSSGFGHHGTLQNGAAWAAGRVGAAALNFDGVDDRIATNGITDVTNNFTLAFWALPTATHEIDPESTGNISGISGQRYAFWPTWYDSGRAGAGVSVGTNGVSVYEHAGGYMPALLVYPATITNWTHIAIVYENKRPKLYINGALVRTGLTSLKDFVHLNPTYIGGQSYGSFAGRLDEVRAYNYALSASEVSALAVPPGPPPSASVVWVQPAEYSWGPPNTMTAAGLAQNGTGTVQMVWRDETAGTGWVTVPFQATPAADGTWSNTLQTSNRCHTYRVYVNYSGVRSADFVYNGVTSGYCSETASVIWIQPQSTAGFGPPGSLVVAGSAKNAPSGTQVFLSYRDVTAGTAWAQLGYGPVPDSNNIWYNAIENANPFHVYQVQVKYDAVTSAVCTYQGTNSISWCQ
jgi:Concanavalin A-like lectin/glucanases superfamily/F5/8 type C domain